MRGNNIQVAYVPGQVFRNKLPDSRTITFNMWTCGIDPATDQVVAGPNQRRQCSDNLKTLQTLFYNGGAQFPLIRQWEYTLPASIGVPTGVPTMVTTTAMAEIASNMQITSQSPNSASMTFSVDFLLADPYFYGPPIVSQINYGQTANILNPGDDVAAYTQNTVTFYGPLQYPRLTNSTTDPTTWVQLNTVILAGDSITFDVGNFTAYRTSDGANLSGSVAHSGTRRWMVYLPGVNEVTLTSGNSLDTGYCTTSFNAPFV